MDMGRHAQRRAANSANRAISASAFMAGFSATSAHREPTSPLLTCAACKQQVFTLVEGQCFACGRPVEGKNYREMTDEQRRGMHECGVLNAYHTDGWDGNWLDCEEAKRRMGR